VDSLPTQETGLFEHYTVHADGSRVTQSSAPAAINMSVTLADVRAGQRVLEIGTGSGYSTARLARAVRPTGQVVSVDVNESLVERARGLLRADGLDNVELVCQDARAGLPAGRPFDRVLAWATAPGVPEGWLTRTRLGGLLVLPVAVAPIWGAAAVARVRWTGTAPVVEQLVAGGYVPLHGPTSTGVADPDDHAEVTWRTKPHGDWTTIGWISAAWLRDAPSVVLDRVRRHGRRLAPRSPMLTRDEAEAFAVFAYTQRRDAVGVYIPDTGHAVGVGSDRGLAVVALATGALWTVGQEDGALQDAVQEWRAAGHPRLSDYGVRVELMVGLWHIRLSLR